MNDYRKYKAALDAVEEIILIVDENGKITDCNSQAGKTFGYKCNYIIGKSLEDFLPSEMRHTVLNLLSLSSTEGLKHEIQFLKKGDVRINVKLKIKKIPGEENSVILVAKEANKKQLDEHRVCTQGLKSLEVLAAGIAHEIGNPLTSIASLVQVIERTSVDEFTKEKLTQIKSQTNRIASVLREIVDSWRSNGIVNKTVNVNHLVKNALNIVRFGTKSKNIEFTLDLYPDLPKVNVSGDHATFILVNILSNAVDALSAGNGKITVISLYTENDIEIVIRCSGKTIPKEQVENLFEIIKKDEINRTSYDLGVCHGIIRNFDGYVLAETNPVGGNIFTIVFPLKDKPELKKQFITSKDISFLER